MRYWTTIALGFFSLVVGEKAFGGVPAGYRVPYQQGSVSSSSSLGGGAGWAASEDLPQPIVTRQTIFAIPFHLVPAQESSQQAVEVQLYVSTDGGRHWQLYQRVRPTEGQFLVRTTGEGEYWFLVRTVDRAGRVRPQGPAHPEMRVLVDLTPPHLALAAEPTPSGPVIIRWKIADRTLRPETLRITYRSSAEGSWELVPLQGVQVESIPEGHQGRVTWNPPSGIDRAELRAEVADAAGNLAVAHAQVELSGVSAVASLNPPSNLLHDQWRATRREVPSQALVPDTSANTGLSQAGGTSSVPPAGAAATAPPAAEANSSSLVANKPLPSPIYPPVQSQFSGLGSEGQPSAAAGSNRSEPPRPTSSPETSKTSSAPTTSSQSPRSNPPPAGPEGASGKASGVQGQSGSQVGAFSASTPLAQPPSSPQPSNSPAQSASASKPSEPGESKPAKGLSQQPDGSVAELASEGSIRMVNSRVFELEYELGSSTPGRVELWATRDGGKTWHCWGPDTDNRSPMIVSVPEEGIYGFRVLVSADPRSPSAGPQPGEMPDVWIGVDWTRPTGRILAVEPSHTDPQPQILIRWEAADRYLADKPISLFYSPTGTSGTWTPIATQIENTGQYLWKVPSNMPDRVYIRLEIRDQAGNLTVDQTRQSIPIGAGAERAKIRDVRPVQPSARAFLPGRLG